MIRPLVRLATLSLACASLVAALSGCAPLIVGGAAVGTMVAVDRRTSGAQLEDEGIELRASSRLRDAMGERSHVNVTSYNRQALLTGEVPSEKDKQAAEQIVARVENVKSVVNDLAVMGSSTLPQRSSDTLVTGRVRASLVDDKDLYSGAFRVVTERGTTYLMGRVTQREADRATAMTRTVGGVQRVVRLFEIISEDELRQIAPDQTRPASARSSASPAS
ncbi:MULTISPECIES: BON domain-containing protein [Ramlibacter]|uniref:BON domain-containing protein n=1 Tax=Ramlibacter pinisoli TaxID=2682844 RepID=A0A6N8IUF1_9BURK|nr:MULTISPECIES: BON domain-containing protein [Ramlibacter]MBA2965482.1 BON domain-containing protein [Ramlibacter sp. CGMCC 1.13660]MVQ30448.1 BON domain-containing protein [Ramlibacter pinisoli]